jgi:hypothetical protein
MKIYIPDKSFCQRRRGSGRLEGIQDKIDTNSYGGCITGWPQDYRSFPQLKVTMEACSLRQYLTSIGIK